MQSYLVNTTQSYGLSSHESADRKSLGITQRIAHLTISADQLARIALDAGKLIMEIYESDFDVDRKGDASPVTEADQRAEVLILKGLAEAEPSLPVVAEESFSDGKVPEHGHRFALVDPL
ncbi:MAG TPA: hypothetical protein DDX09_04900, partial [Hyphomonas atlantica]|nr:hypothetical protein [Hyphomonas atlantica]